MKLQLKGSQSLQSIRIEGKNGEILSGGATVTLDGIGAVPSIAMEAEGSTSVILECNAIQLKEDVATTFIITLPPTVFSKGFIVSIADTDGQTYILETDKKNSVLRSSLLVMPRKALDSSVKYSFWDGKIPTNSPLTQDPASSQTYIIDEAADLAWLSRASNAASIGEGKTLVFKANINMGK